MKLRAVCPVVGCLLLCAALWRCGQDSGGSAIGGDTEDPYGWLAAAFPDTALAGAVLTAAGGDPAAVTSAWMDTVTRFSAPGARIGSLTGIDSLRRLEVLDVSDNDIGDLTPLRSLDSLTFLSLAGNRVEDLAPLSGLARLEILLLAGNRVTDVAPVLGLPRLQALDLSGNPLADDALAGLEALAARGVQVTLAVDTPEAPPDDDTDLGSMVFAFHGMASGRVAIWLGTTDGAPPRRLIDDGVAADCQGTVWSPDGQRIAFRSNRESVLATFHKMYVAEADGSNVRAVSDWGNFGPQCWSPDGTRIAASRRIANDSAELYVFQADGSGVVQLTDPDEALDGSAVWSPDGQRLAFVRRSKSTIHLLSPVS